MPLITKPLRYYLIVTLFLIPTKSIAIGQFDDDLQFDQITVDDGLSQSMVICILQDKNGFIWFGTEDGLNRWDGYEFKIYKYDPDAENSLSDDYLQTIFEDRDGIIWIGTKTGGLNRFDIDTGKFKRFVQDDANPDSINFRHEF